MVKEWSGKNEATIWDDGIRVPSVNDVLANASVVNAFDYDDIYIPTGIHPGALVVTSALAASEMVGFINGRELITAAVLSHEMSARMRSGLG